MKKILVITATLGNRKTLKKTIESVREIGGEKVHHVIVCPPNMIPQIKEKYNNIECLAEKPDKHGIYAALNHGFNTYGHEYEYMTFINDDDYWLPDFKYLINEIENDYDFAYGKIQFVLERKGNRIKPMACSNQFKDFIPLLHSGIVLFTQQATLIKSEIYFRLGGFSENFKLVSDTKFWADLSLTDIKFKYVPKVCAAYTIQEGQLSSDGNIQGKEMAQLRKMYLPPSIFRIKYSTLLYRLKNLNVYIQRLIKK